jgi:predicted RNase H-like HicB family nuclease
MKQMKFAVVIEKGRGSYGAYVPDLPGCAVVGSSRRQAESRIRKAIEMHLSGMVEDGTPIPIPSTTIEMVAARVPARRRSVSA